LLEGKKEKKMPKCYGLDFRKKILETYLNKEGSYQTIADRFKVSLNTVKRIVYRYRETNQVITYVHRSGRRELIDDSGKETLKKLIKEKPDLTLREIQKKYKAAHGVQPVLSVFHRVLKLLKLPYKKKSLFAQQQLREDIKKKRRISRMDGRIQSGGYHGIR
jgi:transposase